MVYVYLVYGLSFFILWTVLWIYHMKLGRFRLSRHLWLIGLFAVTHGASDWIGMLIQTQNIRTPAFLAVALGLLVASFVFLIEFGISDAGRHQNRLLRSLFPLLLLIPVVLVTAFSRQTFLSGEITARYLLGIPGGLLTAYALAAQVPVIKKVSYPRLVSNLKIASIAFLFYTVFTGLVVPEAGFFPASVLNYRTFLSLTGIPVEIFRAAAVLVITFAMTRLLHGFEVQQAQSMMITTRELEDRIKARTSDLKSLNEALRQRELQQKAILDNIPDLAWLKDAEGRFIRSNLPFARSAGTSPEALVGKTDLDVWPRELAERYRADDREVMKSRRRKRVEEPFLHKDGRQGWIETIKTPVYNDRGEVTGTAGISRDVTKRKRVEEALRESEDRYRAITEHAIDGIVTIDENSTIVLANPAVEKIFGYANPELIGKSLILLMPQRLRERHRAAIQRYLATGEKHLSWSLVEVPGLHKDGREIPLELSYGEYSRGGKRFFTGIIRDVTRRREMESALRESERLREIIMDSVPALISYIGNDLRYRFVNHQYETWWNLPAGKIVGAAMRDMMSADEYREIERHVQSVLRGERASYERGLEHGGEKRFVHIDYVPHIGANGEVLGFFTLITDISDRRKFEENLQRANEKLSDVLNSITEAYYAFDSGWRVVEMNREAEKILGPAADLLGRVYWEQFPQNIGSEIDRQYHRAVREKRPVHFEAKSEIAGKWFEIHGYPRGERLEVYFRDITERKQLEEIVEHRAYHDPLTDLPNRLLFEDIVKVEVAQARRNRKKLAILYLDLDRFKEINDTLGHDAGDELLRQVADRLRKSIRESDTVARIGGDEFNMVLSDVQEVEKLSGAVGKITAAFREPFVVVGEELHVTTSIGISIYPDDGRDIERLLKYADMAMYHAKETGRNRYQFYDRALNTRTLEHTLRERRLHEALEQGELTVHYLPQVDVRTRKVAGAEALLRWRHPKLGLLAPAQFMQLAEETGLIVPIGEWVLRTVARQVKAWQRAGYQPIYVTVNLSERQFHQKNLAEMTGKILRDAGLEPRWLELEIPERTAMRDVEFTGAHLRKLTELGVRLSLDNFGTGRLSLNQLKKLPFRKLKIDQSLIRDIPRDQDDRMTVEAMIAMTRMMKIKSAADGVETEEQLRLLREKHCDEVEGYIFSLPKPAEEFEKLLAAKAG